MTKKEYKNIKGGVKYSYNIVAEKYHKLFYDELKGHDCDQQLLDKFAKELPKGSIICDIGCGPSAQMGGYLFEKVTMSKD